MRASAVFLVYALAVLFVGYFVPRENTFELFMGFSVAWLCFGWVWKYGQNLGLGVGIVLAMGLRILLMGSMPTLSDDFYRFIFDGQLLLNGVNPFYYLPKDIVVQKAWEEFPYWKALVEGMNSPAYYSVYPPLHQLFFVFSALAGEDLWGNVFVLRSVFLLFEGLNIYLMLLLIRSWGLNQSVLWLYAFHPLVILEGVGNLHFEIMVLSALLASLYFFTKAKSKLSGIAWSLAVGVKLTPLMLLPLWWKAWKGRQRWAFIGASLFVIALSFWPLLLDKGYVNFLQSLRLYPFVFEFNASVYYLIREIGIAWEGYNPIAVVGPALQLMAGLGILLLAWKRQVQQPRDLAVAMVWVYFIYLIFQTTVHPWYLIPALGISVLTGQRVFMLWSGLVMLSYASYAQAEVKEPLWTGLLQYGLLFGFVLWNYLRRFGLKKSKSVHEK